MPSVLIECGFLTNPDEEDFLHSEEGKNHIASAIFRAFKSYKHSVENMDTLLEKESATTESNLETINKNSEGVSLEKNEDILFKVQVGTYLKSMKNKKPFINISAQEELLNGTFKYYVGSEKNKSNADKIKNKMIRLGFDGAFVVAFYKDVRVSIKEALNLQMKNKE